MKKIWYFLLMACFMVGCNNNNKEKEEEAEDEEQEEQQDVKEPKKSVAKETTWDYHLIGKWHYAEVEGSENTKYPEGIEVFHGDGSYECYTQDTKGQKVLINGTWKLDDKKDFVVWVTQESVTNAKGNVSDEEKTVKYVVNALAPENYLTYQADKTYRIAQWAGQ